MNGSSFFHRMLAMLLVSSGDLMKLYSLVCNIVFSTLALLGTLARYLRSPNSAGIHCSESCAYRWLAGFRTAFFGHGEVAHQEAGVGRPREASGWGGGV